MSSLLRSFPNVAQGLTRFLKPESPCYDDTGFNTIVLFPFTYLNGVLDISYSGNTFEADMVTTLNIEPDAETDVAIRITGGPFLVTSLGSKFKDYVRAWRDGTIDAGSPIEIHIQPTIYRVQQADNVNVDANSGDSYKISTKEPSSDYYVTGSTQNTYQSTYIFKTPLTFTILESGVKKYITFRTQLDQE
jgi:hypothetical protein